MLMTAMATIAIVTQDHTALRASPRETSQQQTELWEGDMVEIRGERMNYLQVYDHRHERAGYIRASQVRRVSTQAEDAPALLSIVRFLRDSPGDESLGISYVAAYLKAAPAADITAEAFDALGAMADRLARQASASNGKSKDAALAAHLEVAASYGVVMTSFERDDHMQLCYNGEAFVQVLAMPATEEEHARAALAVTRHSCVDPALQPMAKYALDNWRTDVLDRINFTTLPEYMQNRVRLRRAGVWAALAFQRAQRGDNAEAAANRSLQELAAVDKNQLPEEDNFVYTDAAVRVGASRLAAETTTPVNTKLSLVTAAGEPGETCMLLTDAKHDQKNPLFKRCTYGQVWAASARSNAQGTALAVAVQPLENWRELWVFQQKASGWTVDVLPPASDAPYIGYLEFAGWVPGTAKMLAVREAKTEGRYKTTYEVISLDTLNVEKQADKPSSLSSFYRWQDPLWKQQTVSLR